MEKPVYAAMSGTNKMEKAEMVLTRGLGLGSFGSTIAGHIEPEESILKGIDTYRKQREIAYIKFKVNNQGLKRVLEFIEGFQKVIADNTAPCNLYNGAAWPRFENEGSGCSAFGMSALDVARLLPPESSLWRIEVKIPMNLIGGEFNNNHHVTTRDVLKTKSWYSGDGVADVDYVLHRVYDPGLIYQWILQARKSSIPGYYPDSEGEIPGIVIDKRDVVIDESEPVFLQRKDSDLFVKAYHQKIRKLLKN